MESATCRTLPPHGGRERQSAPEELGLLYTHYTTAYLFYTTAYLFPGKTAEGVKPLGQAANAGNNDALEYPGI